MNIAHSILSKVTLIPITLNEIGPINSANIVIIKAAIMAFLIPAFLSFLYLLVIL